MKEPAYPVLHRRRRGARAPVAMALALLAGLAATGGHAAVGDTVYVTDELVITFRSQPSNSSEILRNLSSGDGMRIIEEPPGGEWVLVRLPNERQGWVRKQYLQSEPVAQDRLETANREIEQLTRTVADLRARLDTEQSARTEAESSSETLDERVATLTQELAEIRRVSAGALETAAENRRLTELNSRLRDELDVLVGEREQLAENAEQRWLMIGGGLVLLGLILGVIIKARPRRSAWT